MNYHRLSLVIIQHNQKEALLQTLTRLEPVKRAGIAVVVIDYDCNVEQLSDETIRKHPLVYERFEYGPTVLVETAIEQVAQFLDKCGFSHLWVLNPDMPVTVEMVLKANAPADEEVAVWGTNFWGMKLSIKTLLSLGGWETRYFLGMADYDLVYRVRQSGARIGPAIMATVKETPSATRAYFWGKNPWLFIRLNQIRNIGEMIRVGLYSLNQFEFRYARDYLRGMIDGIGLIVKR